MAEVFNLDDYTCPSETLPSVLWRVTHSQSQRIPDTATGEHMAQTELHKLDEAEFRKAAINHFDWNSRVRSCFLSAFKDKDHARNWARLKKDDPDVGITRIITAMLPEDIRILDATSLCEKLEIDHKYHKNELLFLYRVPWQSLGRTRDIGGTVVGKDSKHNIVNSLRQVNDCFAQFIDQCEGFIATLCSAGASTSKTEELRDKWRLVGTNYQEAAKASVSEMVDALQRKEGHGPLSGWSTGDPFRQLMWTLRERDDMDKGKVVFLDSADKVPTPVSEDGGISEMSRLTLED